MDYLFENSTAISQLGSCSPEDQDNLYFMKVKLNSQFNEAGPDKATTENV